MESVWWKRPMRVLQYNLQVRDTAGMNGEKIACKTEELGANVVVMNVGGIYAWYQSCVPFHHVNEYLPKDRDLLKEWIDAFHRHNIRFVARFDFSLADDLTYLKKPQWFARHRDKSPYIRGEKRMGDWNLLLTTCATGGYRNGETAVPVIREVLARYEIDGIFFNAPYAPACFCERCRQKYMKQYGKEMPEKEADFEPDWLSLCTEEHIGLIYRTIKEMRPEVPMILYYTPFAAEKGGAGKEERDNIYERFATADLICTESQDVLSRGEKYLPWTAHPMLAMKAGQTEDGAVRPFGIIHSCPGMDWRHVGMPAEEYLPWMCQVPAFGGNIWHSVTGYPDTISDQRVLRAITEADRMIAKSEQDMEGAVSAADVLLFWNGGSGAKDWADILIKQHIQFDLMHDYRIVAERLMKYRAVLIPEDFFVDESLKDLLLEYAQNGGGVLAERSKEEQLDSWRDFLGITGETLAGEYLYASYMRLEIPGAALGAGMDTDRFAFRGQVNYCTPSKETQVLLTLIPPFAPVEVAGVPPERASLPVEYTDIPLCTMRSCGQGRVMLLPFSFHALAGEFHIKDHYLLAGNMLRMLIKGRLLLETDMPSAVMTMMYQKKNQLLLHLVNEIGQRPLMDRISAYGVWGSIMLPPDRMVKDVRSVIAEEQVEYRQQGMVLEFKLSRLETWDMLSITFE